MIVTEMLGTLEPEEVVTESTTAEGREGPNNLKVNDDAKERD